MFALSDNTNVHNKIDTIKPPTTLHSINQHSSKDIHLRELFNINCYNNVLFIV